MKRFSALMMALMLVFSISVSSAYATQVYVVSPGYEDPDVPVDPENPAEPTTPTTPANPTEPAETNPPADSDQNSVLDDLLDALFG